LYTLTTTLEDSLALIEQQRNKILNNKQEEAPIHP
jgi:hypothetical protein